jgi:hypothetical protein
MMVKILLRPMAMGTKKDRHFIDGNFGQIEITAQKVSGDCFNPDIFDGVSISLNSRMPNNPHLRFFRPFLEPYPIPDATSDQLPPHLPTLLILGYIPNILQLLPTLVKSSELTHPQLAPQQSN